MTGLATTAGQVKAGRRKILTVTRKSKVVVVMVVILRREAAGVPRSGVDLAVPESVKDHV